MSTQTQIDPLIFSSINPEKIPAQLEQLLAENREQIHALTTAETPTRWETVMAPLLDLEDRIQQFWSPVSHLNAVAQTPDIRQAVEACQPKLSEYHTELGQNQALFTAFQTLHQSDDFHDLSDDKQQYIKNTLIDFEHSGIGLDEQQQQLFKAHKSRLSRLSTQFANNLLDATGAWSITLPNTNRLGGLPEDILAQFAQQAQAKAEQGYRITLAQPDFMAVMRFAEDRDLRETVYHAFSTRASETGPDQGRFDNTEIMNEILALRHEIAQMLGFEQFAALSLQKKMADSVSAVDAFLQELTEHARPKAKQELAELTAFAQKHDGPAVLQSWDIPFYSELKRQHDFDFSEQDIKPYFPSDQVINGLFNICSQLFNIRFKPKDGVDIWHEDVRFYEILDENNQVRAGFYLDLYAREHKRGGAWMADARQGGRKGDGQWQTPIAFLTCNFSPPVSGKPALLTHSEVETLFHEFGHGLHHMLARVETLGVSGINGVAWDAVELPSQFMENWCWERESLDLFARHYETHQPLPETLLDKLQRSRLFNVGLGLVRQLEFSRFDLTLHSSYDPNHKPDVQAVLEQTRDQIAVIKPPAYNRFAHGFAHIFAGGYAAGYYSYKWAEVLSADGFARFREEGLLNAQTGRAFREHILERGGSRPAMELFTAFRGRKPDPKALLRQYGFVDQND